MIAPFWSEPAPGTRWLLRLPNWVGDGVLVLPALRALPGVPAERLGVAHPRVAGLYRASGLLGEVLAVGGAGAPWRARAAVRAFRPARAVVFTEAPSGGLLAALSGAPLRLGRSGAFTRLLFTHVLPRATRSTPAWRDHVELVQAAGGTRPTRPDFRLPVDPETRRRAAELVEGAEGFVAVAPGAAYGPAKQWPLGSYTELVRRLRGEGLFAVTLGARGEEPLGAELARAGALDLIGKTGLLDAVAVLARASVLVSNDSGALHLARAAGTPVIALFGSSSPQWTGPEPGEGEVIQVSVPCSPCFQRVCPLTGEDHLRCFTGISVESVHRAVRRLLETTR